MLEISKVNYNNQKNLMTRRIAFKNNNVQAAAPIKPVAKQADSALKNIINIVPDSYIDEIGGIILASAGIALSKGKSQKFNKKLAEMVDSNAELRKALEVAKESVKKASEDAKGVLGGLTAETKLEEMLTNIQTRLGLETDVKIRNAISGQSNNEVLRVASELIEQFRSSIRNFRTDIVNINGRNFSLAAEDATIGIKGNVLKKLEQQLRAESAKRIILGSNGWGREIPQHGDIAFVTSEFKGFAKSGGLADVPQELADLYVKLFDKAAPDTTVTTYMPLYTGSVGKGTVRSLKDIGNGFFEYVEEGAKKPFIAKLKKIGTFGSDVYTDVMHGQRAVDVYEGSRLIELPGHFDTFLGKLQGDSASQVRALQNGQELDVGSFVFSKDLTGQEHVKGKLRTIFLGNDAFNFDIPADIGTNMYSDLPKVHETERFLYFNKFLYDLWGNTQKTEGVRLPSLVMANDWHTGGLAAMMRLLSPTQKAAGELDAKVADHLYSTPIMAIMHNAGVSGGKWETQEKLLNILFGKHAALISKNAYMPCNSGLDSRLLNGLMEGDGVNPQMMLASYSDIVIPVSKGYAQEIATQGIFGGARKDVYAMRARQGEYANVDKLKQILRDSGICDLPDDAVLTKKTLSGITNGSASETNLLKQADIAKISGEEALNLDASNWVIRTYQEGESVFDWHNRNKQVAINVIKRDLEYAQKAAREGRILEVKDQYNMKIRNPLDVDLSGVTVDTPIFVSSGRIADQKGVDIWSDSIVEFYKKYEGDNPPIFWLQGAKQTEGDEKLIQAFLDAKKKVETINPQAAKRMVICESFGDVGRFEISKIMSDFFVMPSWFEPCGLTHKQAAKFSGAIPIVNRTGGLADGLTEGVNAYVVRDFDANRTSKDRDAHAFADAMLDAVNCYKKDKPKHASMVDSIFKTDFDWEKEGGSLEEYVSVMQDLGVLSKDISAKDYVRAVREPDFEIPIAA